MNTTNTPELLTVRTTYETWNEEAREFGDTNDKGWEDEQGTTFDPADQYEDEDETPERLAVLEAVRYISDKGGNSPSSSPVSLDDRTWWSTADPVIDYRTGEDTYYSFHVSGPVDMVAALQAELAKVKGIRTA